jgi:magnesium-transporting ATPase (P-type)
MSAAFLTLICLIIRYCITTYAVKKQKPSGNDVGYFISFLIQAITVVVVSVPEGLYFTLKKTKRIIYFDNK